ncbi:hypothetical protein [Pedobacter sp. L105]|uniref:hypothetical protein n=1 Tax=Pedobacter sp. L105 TaxID=1641871 RepID=UPI00131BFBDB|nr:hypothetical protein [Pedobacter sp. L105]
MIRKEDNLWKGVLSKVFPDFIRFVHPGIAEILDLERGYELLDKELEQVFPPHDEIYSSKIADQLVKVFTKDGRQEWILIHIEIQGKYSRDFGERMFTYFYRLFDKYHKRISVYAIFTEATPKSRPDIFKLEFLDTKLNYRFNVYKITEFTDEELLANENPFALVVLAARTAFAGKDIKDAMQREELMLNLKLKLVRELLQRKIEREKVGAIFKFIKFYIRFENDERNITFDNEVHILTKTITNMTYEEQVQEISNRWASERAVNNSNKKLARKLLFEEGFSMSKIARLLEVPVKIVKKIRDEKVALEN